MPRLSERLARLEDAAAVSARARERAIAATGPSLWERIEAGLLKLGYQQLDNESGAECLARACGISTTDLKNQLAGDWRRDLTPGSIGYYIGGLLVVAKEDSCRG